MVCSQKDSSLHGSKKSDRSPSQKSELGWWELYYMCLKGLERTTIPPQKLNRAPLFQEGSENVAFHHILTLHLSNLVGSAQRQDTLG